MTQLKLSVSGMSCGGCANSVRTILSRKLSVDKDQVEVSLDRAEASVRLQASPGEERLDAALFELKEQGFPTRIITAE